MISLTKVDGRVTTVEVAAEETSLTYAEKIVGVGTAKCMEADVFDLKTGEGIALGRAMQDWGRQVEAIWNARVVTHEEYMRVARLVFRGEQ